MTSTDMNHSTDDRNQPDSNKPSALPLSIGHQETADDSPNITAMSEARQDTTGSNSPAKAPLPDNRPTVTTDMTSSNSNKDSDNSSKSHSAMSVTPDIQSRPLPEVRDYSRPTDAAAGSSEHYYSTPRSVFERHSESVNSITSPSYIQNNESGECPKHIELENLVSTMAERRSPAYDSLMYTAYAQNNAGTTEYPSNMDNSVSKDWDKPPRPHVSMAEHHRRLMQSRPLPEVNDSSENKLRKNNAPDGSLGVVDSGHYYSIASQVTESYAASNSVNPTSISKNNVRSNAYPEFSDPEDLESTKVKELYSTVAASSTHTASPQSNVVTNEYLEPANYEISETTRVKQLYSTVARSGTNTGSLQNISAEDDSDYTDVADHVDSASNRDQDLYNSVGSIDSNSGPKYVELLDGSDCSRSPSRVNCLQTTGNSSTSPSQTLRVPTIRRFNQDGRYEPMRSHVRHLTNGIMPTAQRGPNFGFLKQLSLTSRLVIISFVILLIAMLISVFTARDNINGNVNSRIYEILENETGIKSLLKNQLDNYTEYLEKQGNISSELLEKLEGTKSVLLKKLEDTSSKLLKSLTSLYSSSKQASDMRIVYGDSCYCLFREPLSWNAAKDFCLSKGNEVHLAEIHLPEVNDFLMPILQAALTNQGIWLGASNLVQEEVWRWNYTGKKVEQFDPTQWGPGQPSGISHLGQPEHCLDVYNWNVPTFKWNDHKCSDPQPFLCKSPLSDSICYC